METSELPSKITMCLSILQAVALPPNIPMVHFSVTVVGEPEVEIGMV